MKMYRLTWEERKKPLCSCCGYKEAEAMEHAWEDRVSDPVAWSSQVNRQEGDLWRRASDRDDSHEFRNIQVEETEVEWNKAGF